MAKHSECDQRDADIEQAIWICRKPWSHRCAATVSPGGISFTGPYSEEDCAGEYCSLLDGNDNNDFRDTGKRWESGGRRKQGTTGVFTRHKPACSKWAPATDVGDWDLTRRALSRKPRFKVAFVGRRSISQTVHCRKGHEGKQPR